MFRTITTLLLGSLIITGLIAYGCRQAGGLVVHPCAKGVSQPVAVNEVQDAAFWIHPSQPEKSLLFITNEKRGLEIHDMSGLLLKNADDGIHPCYVGVIYEYPMNGRTVDLALASCTAPEFAGVRVWQIDPEKRKLDNVTLGPAIKVFGGQAPVGLCTYHSRKTGKCYFFVTTGRGNIEQYELSATPEGKFNAVCVRTLGRPGKVKGSVADEERGVVYFAEEKVGVWRFDAEPDGSTEGKCVIRAGENGLVPEVKGPVLYGASGGRGYLLVGSQGPKGGRTCIKVYRREGDNEFVLTIDPSGEGYGKLDHSSGLAVTNAPITADYPQGALAVNDQINPNASEDFKLYSWKDIAQAGHLLVDTAWSPRPSRAKR
jgi:3-phytase